MYVVIARWVAREGEQQAVERALKLNAVASREEPGCQEFTVLRAIDEPLSFVLYEAYDDEDAFRAHRETDHFKIQVLGDAVPRLESRSFAAYEVIG